MNKHVVYLCYFCAVQIRIEKKIPDLINMVIRMLISANNNKAVPHIPYRVDFRVTEMM